MHSTAVGFKVLNTLGVYAAFFIGMNIGLTWRENRVWKQNAEQNI
jgi:hypothetical protein